jgi:very-short-patch-repair endonuclease
MNKSAIEELLALHIRAEKLPEPEREFRFHPTRRWRFDFAYPDIKLAIECEGLTYYGNNKDGSMKLGRHQTAKGYQEDLEKYEQALLLGWTVYRCSGQMVKSGRAIDTIKKLMEMMG